MKEYCSNCCRLTECIDHFGCDNDGRVIAREISCVICHQVCETYYYQTAIPQFYSKRLLEGKRVGATVDELAAEARLEVSYTYVYRGRCIVCGKKFTYKFTGSEFRFNHHARKPLCFCGPKCQELFANQESEAIDIVEGERWRRLNIGDKTRCFICGKTYQEVQLDKVRLQILETWYTLHRHHIYGAENGLETVRLCPGCHHDVHRRNITALSKLVVNLGRNGHKVDERRFASFYSLTNKQMQWLRNKELQYSIS